MRRALIQVYEKHLALGTLNEQQAGFVRQKIHSICMAIDFQDAKQALLEGQFSAALESVQKVQTSNPSWKLALAQIGLRRFPRLLQSLYRIHLRRLQQQYRDRNARSLKKVGFDGLAPNTETFGDRLSHERQNIDSLSQAPRDKESAGENRNSFGASYPMIYGIKTVVKYALGIDLAGRNFAVYPDDTFVVSYPRCGNTWTRFLIATWSCRQGGKLHQHREADS